MLTELKSYLIDNEFGTPTLQDIEEAFRIVQDTGSAVRIHWSVPYSGAYNRTVTPDVIKKMSAQEYFDTAIPHVYGV